MDLEDNGDDSRVQELRKNADKLSQNVMQQIQPMLDQISTKNIEIVKTQTVLKESLERENNKLSSSNGVHEIKVAMAKVKFYQKKLEDLKKEMKYLQNKSKDMKQRGIKLEEKKIARDKKLEEKRKKEIEHEQSLIAKPAANSNLLEK